MRGSRERKRPAWQNDFQLEQVAKEPKPKPMKDDEKLQNKLLKMKCCLT